MAYNFDFNVDLKGNLSIGIMRLGLVFNKKCISKLNFPKKINIGVDFENKKLAIKEGQETLGKTYKFVTNEEQKWIRVPCMQVIKKLEQLLGVKYTDKQVYYKAYYDEQEKVLIVDLI